jgi:hypothetical protein
MSGGAAGQNDSEEMVRFIHSYIFSKSYIFEEVVAA